MPNSELAAIFGPQASSRDVVRHWIVKFSEICGREITSALTAIWIEQLSDIPPRLLDQACDRLAKTCTAGFLPTPGAIRAEIERADARGFALQVEENWDRLLNWIRAYFIPDVGIAPRAPALEPAIEFAARAAGGFRWLESCPESELQWAKKRFVEALTRVNETRQAEHLLTRGEAKRILARFSGGSPQPQRSKELAEVCEPETEPPSRAEVRAALERIIEIPAAVAPTEEEFQRRKQEQLARQRVWLAAHASPEPAEAVAK